LRISDFLHCASRRTVDLFLGSHPVANALYGRLCRIPKGLGCRSGLCRLFAAIAARTSIDEDHCGDEQASCGNDANIRIIYHFIATASFS
jgi:hypothetical protein